MQAVAVHASGAMHRALVVLALASSACSAGAGAAGGSSKGPDASTSSVDGGTGDDADATVIIPCDELADAQPDGTTCVLEAKGTVEDLSGAPLDKLVMTFCGGQCYGTQSGVTGAYTIAPIGAYLPTQDYAMHADGRPDHAVDYLRLTADEPSIINVSMRLPLLPPSTVLLPPDGSPASSITVGDVTLVIADGTKFDLDIEDFGTGNVGRTLRVVSVPLASAPAYAKAASVAAIYALAPSSAVPSIPMGVILKNSAALPASSAVDFMVLGDDYSSLPPNVGLLAVAASGHVSADGQTIQTDPGEGISDITWLAVRGKGN
jgi:hypothetical protein